MNVYCSALDYSVVDYAIADKDPSSMRVFAVRPQLPLHSIFEKNTKNQNNKDQKLLKLNTAYKWSSSSVSEFIKASTGNLAKTKKVIFQKKHRS